MNTYWIGVIIGSVIFAYLWSRLWLWLVGRVVKTEPRRLIIAYGLAWSRAVVLAALGFANEDGLAWGRAISINTPSLALWVVVDLLAKKGRKS